MNALIRARRTLLLSLMGAALPLLSAAADYPEKSIRLIVPFAAGGGVDALARPLAGSKRMASLPDTPTVAETLPGFEALNWFVLAVPVKTPPAVVQRLHAAALEAMRRPALRQMIERDGLDVRGGSPAEARAFVVSENDKWTKIVKEKGLEMQ